ncbi:MAG: glycosyltransferase family 39 protein [Aggregatilineales bacterium]
MFNGRWTLRKRERAWFLRAFTGQALILLLMASLYYAVGLQQRLDAAMACVSAGGISLGIALLIHNRPVFTTRTQPSPAIITETRTGIRWIPLFAGVIMLAMLADASGNIVKPAYLLHLSHHIQFAYWVAGTFLVGWGIAGYQTTRKSWIAAQLPVPLFSRQAVKQTVADINWREVLAVTLILALATAVRAWNVGYAVRLFVDEIHFANPVIHFYRVNDIELLRPFSSVAAFPYLFPYMQWHFVEIFGRNLVGLRMLSVVLGVVTVFVLYLLAREMFDVPLALLASVLLAAFPLHIHFSRLALNNIADPIFGMLAMLFILRGIKPHRRMRPNFVWAGVALGLTQYFYEGGRLLYPALIIVWIGAMGLSVYGATTIRLLWGRFRHHPALLHRAQWAVDSVDYPRLAGAILTMMVTAVLISAPVYYALIGLDKPVVTRLETAGISERTSQEFETLGDIAEHFENRMMEAYLIHVAIPESALYYIGTRAFLLWFVLPFFFIGAWSLIFMSNHRGSLLILLWILMTWFGNTFLQESRISARYVVELPALALTVALGVKVFAEIAVNGHPRARNRLMAVIVSGLVVGQVYYYFEEHLPKFNVQFRGEYERVLDSHDVLFRAAELPAGTIVHVIGDPVMSEFDADQLLGFLVDNMEMTTMTPDNLTDSYLQMMPVNFHHAFFVDIEDEDTLNRIRAQFPYILGPIFSNYPPLPQDRQFALFFQPRLVEVELNPESSP